MTDVDLSDVPPLLRAQVRRRIRAIRQYLSPTKPTTHTARYFANRLEMSEASFRNLVTAWRRYGKASALPGSSFRGGLPHTLAPEIATIVDQVRGDAIPGARFSDIMRSLRQRCAELSLDPPTRMTVARHLAVQREKKPEARPGRPRSSSKAPLGRYDGPPLLLIDHLDLPLPVFDGDGTAATASVTLAILLPEHTIVTYFVSSGGPTPQSAAQVLLKTLGCETIGTPARELTYQLGSESGWTALESALKSADILVIGRELKPLLDVKADLRDEITRLVSSQVADRALLACLTPAQAKTCIGTAIDRYNYGFGSSENGPSIPPFTITRRPKTAAARARLAEIAKQRTGPLRTSSSG